MKIKIFKTNLGEVFDPNKNFTTDKNIVLKRHPKEPNEGATLGYLDSKLEEFYNTADIKGTIDDVSVLQIKGPDITHDSKGLWVKDVYKGDPVAVVVEVNKHGRITKNYPLDETTMDTSTKISWNDVTGKPTTVEGYGITDLASKNKYEKITGKMTVKYQDKKTKSPVPYSHLKTIWDRSNYELQLGDLVIKFGKIDPKKWVPADGRTIYRKDYPEAVDYLAGKNANEVKVPDARERDLYLLNSFGVEANTYMCVKL